MKMNSPQGGKLVGLFAIFILLAVNLTGLHGQEEDLLCIQPIDLVFALESSGRIAEHHETIKSFTENIINTFDIGSRKTHVSVVTFGDFADLQIKLTDNYDKNNLIRKVENLVHQGSGGTATDDVIRVLRDSVFSPYGQSRQGVVKVVILLTNGKCTSCTEELSTLVNPLKDMGIAFFTVGVTENIDSDELKAIASEPYEHYGFEVFDFGGLSRIISSVASKVCSVNRGKCSKPTPPYGCAGAGRDECNFDGDCVRATKCCFDGCERKCSYPIASSFTPMDIAFAFDSSNNVQSKTFEQMKQFAINMVKSFHVSPYDTRFASLTFSDESSVDFNFAQYDLTADIIQAITRIGHRQTDIDLAAALKMLKSDIFSLHGQVRTTRPMVLVLFYDGNDSKITSKDLHEAVTELKDYGVKIVNVGVGSQVNTNQLNMIAESSSTRFTAKSFDSLMSEMYTIGNEIGRDKPGQCQADTERKTEAECQGETVEDECDSDFDCHGQAKCCKQGCSNKCIEPITQTSREVDFAFIIHQDMRRTDFAISQYFLRSALTQFEIGPEKAHMAVATFGAESKVVFDFNTTQNVANLRSRLDALAFRQGKGTILDALVLGSKHIFTEQAGMRRNMPKIMVILTTEFDQSNPSEVASEVKTLRENGVQILVIGIGNNIDTRTLQSITSDDKEDEGKVMLIKNFPGALLYLQDIVEFAENYVVFNQQQEKEEVPQVPGALGEQTCKPKACIMGAKGARGRPGKYGDRGTPGPRGEPGYGGLSGPGGDKGEPGPTGPRGDRGQKGIRGAPGYPGFDGIPGVPGVAGRPGLPSACGVPGSSGEAGPVGQSGTSGAIGPRGPEGPKGAKGKPAPELDIPIRPGDKGQRGRPALRGNKGTKGEPGFLGQPGDDGVDGSNGQNGEAGEPGDFGMNTRMEKGVQGEEGDRGDPGPAGEAASTGGTEEILIGQLGFQGNKGDKGAKGPKGYDSFFDGFQGPRGEPGQEGQMGDDGSTGSEGPQGFDGELGIAGFPGDTGDRGDEGRPGIKGQQGEESFIPGRRGNKGQKGSSGVGRDGTNGDKGEEGDEGLPGVTGIEGVEGERGAKGAPGESPMGRHGDQGEVGRVGRPGPKGQPGQRGMPGDRGITKGESGDKGKRGDNGPNGQSIPGDHGMDGPPGRQGVQGSRGERGPTGPRGLTIMYDESLSNVKTLKGKPGPQGAPGQAGPKGPKGQTGPKGYNGFYPPPIFGEPGSDGDKGKDGFGGFPGFKGDNGDQGLKGSKGPEGRVGPDGRTGIKGKVGEKGEPGMTGRRGRDAQGEPAFETPEKGYKGYPGESGTRGRRGEDGPKGLKGATGSIGEMGRRGINGLKGETGLQGEIGEEGLPGFDGEKGDQGEVGFGDDGAVGEAGRDGEQGRIGGEGFKGRKGEPGQFTPDLFEKFKEKRREAQGPRGPKGDEGVEGPRGPPGRQGRRGPKGEQGEFGIKGFGGRPGDMGFKGSEGEKGIEGPSGIPGQSGRRGSSGEPGRAGKAGNPDDIKGSKGEEGERGPNGFKGPDASTDECPPSSPARVVAPNSDIAFIMDSSNSVNKDTFERQKEFVSRITQQFLLGPKHTQAGVITYGEKANIEINFDDYSRLSGLQRSIASMQHDSARESRLDLALEMAQNKMLTSEHGARPSAEKILIILGDGFTNSHEIDRRTLMHQTRDQARVLKKAGVEILVISVGVERNIYFMKELASTKANYFEAESYDELFDRLDVFKASLTRDVSTNPGCVQRGEPGKNGVQGFTGERGPRGDQGQPGEGVKGFQGTDGPKGYKGEPAKSEQMKGERGIPGFPGFKGEQGRDGQRGRQVSGKKGAEGEKGERIFGQKGRQGRQGENGEQGPKGPDGPALCDEALTTDLLFVVDTSSNTKGNQWPQLQNYIRQVIASFDVHNLLTRVSVITYGLSASLDIKLNDYNTESELLKAINFITYHGGNKVNTGTALLSAAVDGFSEMNGGRDGVNKVVVLIMDSSSTTRPDDIPIKDSVLPLNQINAEISVVGIGNDLSLQELKDIATEGHIVYARDHDDLENKVDDLIKLMGADECKGVPGPPALPGLKGDSGLKGKQGPQGNSGSPGKLGKQGLKGAKGEQGRTFGNGLPGFKGDTGDEGPAGLAGCNENVKRDPIDLGFVIDGSASLLESGFRRQLQFITSIVERLGPLGGTSGAEDLRVGVVVYGNNAAIRIFLDDYQSDSSFKRALESLEFRGTSESRIDQGFEKAKQMFEIKNGARPSTRKMLVLMTDGQQTYVPGIKEPHEIAQELREDGVEILAIGIGEEVDTIELESFTGDRDQVFLSPDLRGLFDYLLEDISQALTCTGGPRGEVGEVGTDGSDGEDGSNGQSGEPGAKGEDGDSFGEKGDQGSKGYSGFDGADGEKGFRGRDGEDGARGASGNKGSRGRRGVKGEQGIDAFDGFDGFAGRRGRKGAKGSDGQMGQDGDQGDRGFKGFPGDAYGAGESPDFKEGLRGDEGNQGGRGNAGEAGEPGRMFSAPGELGLAGLKGEPGLKGQRGQVGEIGEEGPIGYKGEQGERGSKGNKGYAGFPGFFGDASTEKGSRGEDGTQGRSGEDGTPGFPGFKGEMGEEGLIGFKGIQGNEGRKGESGEQGPQGRMAQFSEFSRPTAGLEGEKGREGDQGYQGEMGEPGYLVGSLGETGEKGARGPQGRRGEVGESGPKGRAGTRQGPKGYKGEAPKGLSGETGTKGQRGEGYSDGEGGDLGDIGLRGRQGARGDRGEPNFIKGFPGDNGPKGEKGGRGFHGITGSPGPEGRPGLQGPIGDKGPEGKEGPGGPAGTSGSASDTGHVIVRHSQNAFIPSCPKNYKMMWEGYSLMYTVGNGYAHSQDLGDAGSCSRSFSTLPFLFCGITGTCQYASRNDFTYWLAGDVRQPMMPVTNDAVEPFISRCVVCQAPDINMAVHSQDVVTPSCPVGYDSLWSGFSFMMVAAAGNTGAGQSLGSSGSCLEEFRPKPFIECQGARGSCHFFSDKFSFWLTTIEQRSQFTIPSPQTLSATKGDDLTSRVSRCRVCVRKNKVSEKLAQDAPQERAGFGGFFDNLASWI